MLAKGDVKALWRHFDGGFFTVISAGIITMYLLIAGVITPSF